MDVQVGIGQYLLSNTKAVQKVAGSRRISETRCSTNVHGGRRLHFAELSVAAATLYGCRDEFIIWDVDRSDVDDAPLQLIPGCSSCRRSSETEVNCAWREVMVGVKNFSLKCLSYLGDALQQLRFDAQLSANTYALYISPWRVQTQHGSISYLSVCRSVITLFMLCVKMSSSVVVMHGIKILDFRSISWYVLKTVL